MPVLFYRPLIEISWVYEMRDVQLISHRKFTIYRKTVEVMPIPAAFLRQIPDTMNLLLPVRYNIRAPK